MVGLNRWASEKRKIYSYFSFQGREEAVSVADNSSMLEVTDLGTSSTLEAWKFIVREEKKGSVAAVDGARSLLELNLPPPPRRFWSWASRSSWPNSKSAWLSGIVTLRSLWPLCTYPSIKETQTRTKSISCYCIYHKKGKRKSEKYIILMRISLIVARVGGLCDWACSEILWQSKQDKPAGQTHRLRREIGSPYVKASNDDQQCREKPIAWKQRYFKDNQFLHLFLVITHLQSFIPKMNTWYYINKMLNSGIL